MNISLPTNTLKASLHCAAKTDVRYYLNGVYIYAHGLHCELVSTNGHILSAFRVDNCAQDYIPETSVIIPLEIAKQAIALHKKAKVIDMVITKITDSNGERTEFKLGGIEFKPVDGNFPDYNRVIPRSETLVDIAPANFAIPIFDPAYLELAKKALTDHYQAKKEVFNLAFNLNGGPGVMHRGENCALVCIMPVRPGNYSINTFNSLKIEG